MSNLVKKCPTCGLDNSESESFCKKCGGPILDVEAKLPESPVGSWACPQCQFPNSQFVFLCSNCHAPRTAPPAGPRCLLVIEGQEFECREGDVLGREGSVALELLAVIKEVSRRHVELIRQDGKWGVKVLPNVPNITELDGQRMQPGVPRFLSADHKLRMSTKCEVLLRITSP
jgi:hypothetical protein